MHIVKFLCIAALAALLAVPALAKEKLQNDSMTRSAKIVQAEETLGIEIAKDIPDPDKPRRQHAPGSFLATLYSEKSAAWNTLTKVEPVSSPLGGYKFRLLVDEPEVQVTLEELRYWPGVEWYQPIGKVMEFTTQRDGVYEFTAPLAAKRANYRLAIDNGNKIIYVPLQQGVLGKGTEKEFEGQNRVIYHLDEHEPMSHLARVYAYWTALKGEDVRKIRTLYWRTIATSWSMVMGQVAKLDEDGYYHSTEWFFDEFAYALFPGVDWPDLRREDHVLWFAERPEPYVIRRRTFDINDVLSRQKC